VHWKLRAPTAGDGVLEFTSQLFFDDALTDVVFTRQPYAARGARTTRNAGDGIFQDGGTQLVLALADDGAGGYTATFDVALEVSAVPTTTTTLPGATCATIAACTSALAATLPDPAAAPSARARRTAVALQRRMTQIGTLLERAAATAGRRQAKRYARATAALRALVARSRAAEGRGTLGVPLAPLQAAAEALLARLPA
jgi:hypothetical protein